MKRLFRQLPLRKDTFLDPHISTNVSVNNTRTESVVDNKSINKVLNSQDIFNSVNSAYDKTIDVLNKVSHEVNKSSEALAKAKTVQSNVINLKDAVLRGSKLTVTQTNKALITVALTATLQYINEMTTDNKTKAIVADMLGVTQSADVIQKTVQAAAQEAATIQEGKQETEQSQENFGDLAVTTDVSVQNINQISKLSNYTDNLQDNSIRDTSIQNYMTTLNEKMRNEQEFVDNIKNTIQAVSDENQSNVLDMEGLDAEDTVLEFNQINELTSDVTHGFQELMDEVKTVVGSTETDISGEVRADQTSTARQDSEQKTSQTGEVGQTATQTTTQTTKSMWVTIIIAVVAIIALASAMKVIFGKKKDKK
jgi:hypothetical protein